MARTYRYCDPDLDVRELIEKVTDTVIDDDDVNYMVDIACDIIDSRLVYKYTVPFTSTPPLVKHIASHLATYLVLRRLYSKTRGGTFDNSWVDKFKEFAEEMLKSLFDGDMILINSDGSSVATKSDYGASISTQGYTPIFNEAGELNWQIDWNKADAATQRRGRGKRSNKRWL